MPNIIANGINIHYWQVGKGPDLVMLHGLLGNLAIWHLKMVPTLRKEFRVTTFDLRGHGRTDMPPTGYTTRDMADDLLGLMDALGVEQAHMVGHSMGADVILHLGLLHPHRVNKMVLVEAAIPALAHLRKHEDWKGWTYWVDLLKEFAGIDVPPDKRTDFDYLVRQSLKVPIIFGPAKGLPRKQDGILKLLDTTTIVQDYEDYGDLTLDNLARISHPKLLIYDSGSPYLGTYEVIREILTNCTPVLLPATEHRHFSPLERPDMLIEYINTFVHEDRLADFATAEETQE